MLFGMGSCTHYLKGIEKEAYHERPEFEFVITTISHKGVTMTHNIIAREHPWTRNEYYSGATILTFHDEYKQRKEVKVPVGWNYKIETFRLDDR